MIESINAVTLATHDMARAVRFYRMLGLEIVYGGDTAGFTSFRAGKSYLNLGRSARHVQLVVVGARHLSSFRRGRPLRQRCCRGSPAGHRTARRRMGRALLSHHRSGRSRAQLCMAVATILTLLLPELGSSWALTRHKKRHKNSSTSAVNLKFLSCGVANSYRNFKFKTALKS